MVLAGGSASSRASLAATRADLQYVTLVDPPTVSDRRIGSQTLLDEIDWAAAMLFVVDDLPLPEADLALLIEAQKMTERVVFVADDQPRLREELVGRVVRFADAPCVSRTNRTGLGDALRTVAEAGRLYRQSLALRAVRSAAIESDTVLRERLGAVRRDEAHLARIRKQLAAASARPPWKRRGPTTRTRSWRGGTVMRNGYVPGAVGAW